MSAQEKLEQWANKNGVEGIRFSLANPRAAVSSEEIFNSALSAISALEKGAKITPYSPDVADQVGTEN